MQSLEVVILAAGQGTRMKSAIPKVLHPVGNIPMIERVVHTAMTLDAAKIVVVYGKGGDMLRDKMSHLTIDWVKQEQRLGTGHAVMQALPELSDGAKILILYADVPLISKETLLKLKDGDLNVLTATFDDPKGLGRIVRDEKNNITAIVEHKDASVEQKKINEINSGILSTRASLLKKWLPKLTNENAQKEYYLTDIIKLAVEEGRVVTSVLADPNEVHGVNDLKELAFMERTLQLRNADELMQQGVTLMDPNRFDLRGELEVGQDVVIDINVIIEGKVSVGNNTTIGPNCIIINSKIGDDVVIKANSIIDNAVIENGCEVGPFARLRPKTHLKNNARIGNFVETKNVTLGEGSKANHLSYIGDATVGSNVNIGAGTITCNYDGVNKHHTTIEDNAFIGSNSQLVAPVTVGANAVVGAGSTITKDAPAGELTVARSVQKTIENWKRPSGD